MRALMRGALVAALLLAGCEARAPDATPAPAAPAPAATPAPASVPEQPTGSVESGYTMLDATVVGATDTLESLRARLGADQVVATRVPGAEGEEVDGWQVHPDDPARRLYVYLDDATGHPSLLRVLDPESRWQRGDGIRMGRTLADLAARNGKPVGFTGFDWDYGGACCEWNGGALARDPPTGGMTLCPPPVEGEAGPDYPMGDAQFDSTNPWVVAHTPAVCEFSLVLEPKP